MLKSTFFQLTWCALGLLTIGAQQTFAQARVDSRVQSSQGVNIDPNIASCLILMDQNEVTVAKWAAEKTKNDKVKEFAQRLQKDHSRCIDELSKFTSMTFRDRDLSGSKSSGGGNANQGQVGAATRPVVGQGATDPWAIQIEIKREVADECLASARQTIDKEKGEDLDQCFIGMQIGAHTYMVDELKVLERRASPQLQSVLREERETAQKHLDQAKDIMKSLTQSSGKRSSDKD
jgi:predicted outer membrane protein